MYYRYSTENSIKNYLNSVYYDIYCLHGNVSMYICFVVYLMSLCIFCQRYFDLCICVTNEQFFINLLYLDQSKTLYGVFNSLLWLIPVYI